MADSTNKLELAVNHAVSDALSRARVNLLNPNGFGLDSKRSSAWAEYGYKADLDFDDLYKLYRRGGLAFGAVSKLNGNCWKTHPWLIEGDANEESKKETQWDKAAKKTFTAKLWRAFAEADKRRLAGRYSALLLQINDGGDWDQPVSSKGKKLVGVVPVWEAAIKVKEYETSLDSDNYGLPKMWKYQEIGTDGRPKEHRDVHPDRVFILGDYTADAIGFLEPVYNNFVNIEKVEGGGGESFLKNASRQLNVNFDKEIDFANLASLYGVKVDELQERFNEVAKEINQGNDVLMTTQGATVSTLVANVPDPTPTYDINLQTVSAGVDIPAKVLVGMQTGERASTEDQKYFNARCQSRRNGDLGYEISELAEHLTRISILKPVGEFTVMWDDLNEPTLTDKLDNAKKMSEVNASAISTGEEVFSQDEIRSVAGYETKDESDPLPDVEDEEETTDPTA